MSHHDRSLTATWFHAVDKPKGDPIEITLREFIELVATTHAPRKHLLPLISFFRFDGNRRNTANAQEFSAVACDYDAGEMSLTDATARFREARVSAALYETPSSTRSAPRWRVIVPMSRNLPANLYEPMVARVNGVVGGVLAPESFSIAQQYFVGYISESRPCRTKLI